MSLDLLPLIDLTSLNENDDAAVIAALCQKAYSAKGHVAAVCIYPQFVAQAKKLLDKTPVKIATVANFPYSTEPLEQVISTIKTAISHGANEIDVVFPYVDYLQGKKESSYDFIRACKAACGEDVLLKVILETGVLQEIAVIEEVSFHLAHAGADFLKTSTGKTPIGATLEAASAMLRIIKKIPRPIGLKVSGGVRTVEQANQYIQLAAEIMGKAWLQPEHFRIGASQLVGVILGV